VLGHGSGVESFVGGLLSARLTEVLSGGRSSCNLFQSVSDRRGRRLGSNSAIRSTSESDDASPRATEPWRRRWTIPAAHSSARCALSFSMISGRCIRVLCHTADGLTTRCADGPSAALTVRQLLRLAVNGHRFISRYNVLDKTMYGANLRCGIKWRTAWRSSRAEVECAVSCRNDIRRQLSLTR